MSHFSLIKTQFQDLHLVKKALKDLNYRYSDGENLKIFGFDHQQTGVDLAIHLEQGYDIGLKKNQKTNQFDIVADWYGVKIKKEAFMQSLMQRYAYHKVLAEAEKQGFTISETHQETDGSIRMVLRQWQ